jgi:hypothetical protein
MSYDANRLEKIARRVASRLSGNTDQFDPDAPLTRFLDVPDRKEIAKARAEKAASAELQRRAKEVASELPGGGEFTDSEYDRDAERDFQRSVAELPTRRKTGSTVTDPLAKTALSSKKKEKVQSEPTKLARKRPGGDGKTVATEAHQAGPIDPLDPDPQAEIVGDTIVIDLGLGKRMGDLDEGVMGMFGSWVHDIMKSMFQGGSLPVTVRGTRSEVESFSRALSREKNHLQTFSKYGLDNPRTFRTKAELDQAVGKFERATGLKWPFVD